MIKSTYTHTLASGHLSLAEMNLINRNTILGWRICGIGHHVLVKIFQQPPFIQDFWWHTRLMLFQDEHISFNIRLILVISSNSFFFWQALLNIFKCTSTHNQKVSFKRSNTSLKCLRRWNVTDWSRTSLSRGYIKTKSKKYWQSSWLIPFTSVGKNVNFLWKTPIK